MTSQSCSGTRSASGSGSISSSQNENSSPLWETELEKWETVGGTWNFRCNICGDTHSESYTRIKAHLLQISGEGVPICKKVTRSQKLEMVRLVEEWENKNEQRAIKEVTLPCQSQAGVENDSSSKKRKYSLSPLAISFNMNARAQLDEEIARMFYTSGFPFNLVRNPHYHRAFVFATTHNIPGYVPLGYNKLWTTLFQQEKIIMLKSSCNRLKQHVKDKFFIANLIKEVIDEVGHQNVA
ncbi:hypothetical protein V6N11_035374 [Hibiscus sabdariffa]|uniref:BED-type domain-containing protein n=1 Tax=Hibiscus sabdariffa TaxID=183260 RepID=A0ABR2R0B2_9ROSI